MTTEPGETDLASLLAAMRPELHATPYVFCSVDTETLAGLSVAPLGLFRETEGITLIVTSEQAGAHGLSPSSTWACITLKVHSSLAAVGFLAAISTRLAQAGISLNAVSAYYHDHLFVPWESREQALRLLQDW